MLSNRTTLGVPGLAVLAALVGQGCIPKRSCEFTKTCASETSPSVSSDAGSATQTNPSGSSVVADAAVVFDAAATGEIDARVADSSPVVACTRSADCTEAQPFCDLVARVCTTCRDNDDCRSPDAPVCLVETAQPELNRCVQCRNGESDCDEGTCADNRCVNCDPRTNAGCVGTTSICTEVNGTPTCVACTTNADCASTPDTPTCSDYRCKACSAEDATQCPTDAPVCVEEPTQARCVQCTENNHCRSGEEESDTGPVCIEETCTACELGSNDGCPSSYPYCAAAIPVEGTDTTTYFAPTQSETVPSNQYLEYEHACVACLTNAGCMGGSRPACFNGACVECTGDAHCTQTSAAVCDVDAHTCIGCQAVGDCAHLADTPACDIEHGVCVECTASEGSCADGKACQTVPGDGQNTCSSASKGQTSPCLPCLSDEACLPGTKCVQENVDGEDRGWRCFWRQAELDDGNECGDVPVFAEPFEGQSVDGAAGPYCAPRLTSCQGYRDFGVGTIVVDDLQTCLSHEDCGIAGVDDGFCVPFTTNANRCTYRCVSDQDCDSPVQCATTTGVDQTDAKVCLPAL